LNQAIRKLFTHTGGKAFAPGPSETLSCACLIHGDGFHRAHHSKLDVAIGTILLLASSVVLWWDSASFKQQMYLKVHKMQHFHDPRTVVAQARSMHDDPLHEPWQWQAHALLTTTYLSQSHNRLKVIMTEYRLQ
jgi:hypothetical protein